MAVDSTIEIRGFVQSLLYARKNATTREITKALFEDDPMLKGPFVSLSLPFIQGRADEWPLNVRLKSNFVPYAHQLEAYSRLGGEAPKHTLVTTGTGSGKSECFLLPILNYVMQSRATGKTAGVKALIIYPMNALIDDQAERLAGIVSKLDPGIRVGRYTGDNGTVKEISSAMPDKVIDNRDVLCQDPPDILLTNYRMLDLMLLRPEEKLIWGDATKDVFRFLVLDELHTFDGAQGADVSCLIRRLRAKLAADFTCVGTSATVAGGGASDPVSIEVGVRRLCDFATTLFGVDFGPGDVIREKRVALQDFLRPMVAMEIPQSPIPTSEGLLVKGKHFYQGFLDLLCKNWGAPESPVERAPWVLSHSLFHRLMDLDLRGIGLPDIADALSIKEDLLVEFLDLVATARVKRGETLSPLLPLSVQLWVAETSYMLRQLADQPVFRRGGPANDDQAGYLPAVHCRNCGFSGWAAKIVDRSNSGMADGALEVRWSTAESREAFFDRKAWILFPVDATDDEASSDEENVGVAVHFDPLTGMLFKGHTPESATSKVIRLIGVPLHHHGYAVLGFSGKKKKKDQKCPDCNAALALALTSVGGSMLGSVLAGVFLAHGANPDDRKLLMFNDSVQDAAHQAGYMGARGYRFNVRRYIVRTVEVARGADENVSDVGFAQLRDIALKEITALWHAAAKRNSDAKRQLMQIIPKDLWERWRTQTEQVPFNHSGDFLQQLIDRVLWEIWLEFTLNSDLGWSVKKSGVAFAQLKLDVLGRWAEIAKNIAVKTQLGELADPLGFAAGFAGRLVKIGAVYNRDLAACYKGKNYSIWPLKKSKPHLNGIFHADAALPQVLVPVKSSKGPKGPQTYLTANGRSWFDRWTLRALAPDPRVKRISNTKIMHFLTSFVEAVNAQDAGLINVSEHGDQSYVLRDDVVRIVRADGGFLACDVCGTVQAWGEGFGAREIRCTHYRCGGGQRLLSDPQQKDNEEFRIYLASHYRRPIEAVFSHAHTGALDGDDRRKIESAFKRELLPGEPIGTGLKTEIYQDHPINLLACTPTLEMGIDIGTLSGVVLRGFPRNLASTIQRVGRSGRTSGNSFNSILVTRKPHDRYHWIRPDEIFKGGVTPPGCEFRTKDILRRQFHAFLLDMYAAASERKKMPSVQHGVLLAESIYWRGFAAFLRGVDQGNAVDAFLSEVKRGSVSKPENDWPVFYKELRSYLLGAFDPKFGLWSNVLRILNSQDQEVNRFQALIKKSDDAPARAGDVGGIDAVEGPANKLCSPRREKRAKPEYTLMIMGDQGILPNYAFPEDGVGLSSSVWRRKAEGARANGTFFADVKDQSRPVPNALTELAPGQSF